MNLTFWKKKTFKLDCRGLSCPHPVIRTRDALDQSNRLVAVAVDNEAAKNNIIRFAEDRHCTVTSSGPENGCWTVSLRVGRRIRRRKQNPPGQYSCASASDGKLVCVISSASMGRGNTELGWALLQTYIQTIEKIKPLPSKILLYNGGVRLVAEESGALEALHALQRQGVEILVCGTCLDFFELTSAIKVGKISNMYEIMSTISTSAQVVSPF